MNEVVSELVTADQAISTAPKVDLWSLGWWAETASWVILKVCEFLLFGELLTYLYYRGDHFFSCYWTETHRKLVILGTCTRLVCWAFQVSFLVLRKFALVALFITAGFHCYEETVRVGKALAVRFYCAVTSHCHWSHIVDGHDWALLLLGCFRHSL